jgi:hypothetical protein
MGTELANYPNRVAAWLQIHSGAVRDWIQFRCREQTGLDEGNLHRAAIGYMKWCPLLACAASDTLASRGWLNLKNFVDNDLALALLSTAEETPVGGEDRVPVLLQTSFIVNDTLHQVNNAGAPLFDVDTKKPLQMGFTLLGESRGQQFAQMAQQFVENAGMYLVIDTTAASVASVQQPPAHVPSLETVIAGGRELTELERSLVGHWIYQEFYPLGGGSSGRIELHIWLLPDGHCIRTSRSVASSTFYDSAGNWMGFADAESNLPADERGSWNATSALLTLEMDDGSAYDYRYEVEGSKMITRTSRGTKFWMRSRL